MGGKIMNFDRNYSINLIKELCCANGVSGFEDEVIEVGKNYTRDFADIEENHLRNLYIKNRKNKGNRPVVMVDAHSDELGLMVQHINNNGTLSFITIGGWVSSSLPSSRFRILNDDGEYIKATVAAKPPHFMSGDERTKAPVVSELVLDVGATSKEELLKDYKISVGAPCVPDVGFEYNEKNGVVMTKALDDRIACAAVVEIMRAIKDLDLEVDVVGTFTAQEEIGERGALSAVKKIHPDVAIVLEGTPSDDTFMSSEKAQAIMHGGVQVRYFDRSMVNNPRFNKFAQNIAKENNIKTQRAVRSGGSTNGGIIHQENEGIPCIVLGVPTRYAHSHHGYCAMDDYENTVSMVVEILKALKPQDIESF